MLDSHLQPSISDDEIDLRELAAAVGRRWRWVVAGLVLGVSLGGLAAWRDVPQLTLRLVVNLDQGPQVRYADSIRPLTDNASTRLQLEQLVPLALRKQGWEVAPLRQGKEVAPSILAVSATVALTQQGEATGTLERIARQYSQQQEQLQRQQPLSQPPQSSWIKLVQEAPESRSAGRSYALGGLAGLVVGVGMALVADRRSNRVYGLNRLKQLLPYPAWGSLPKVYPEGPLSAQAEAQLAAFLRPELAWRVLTIATEHPRLLALVQGLQRVDPQLDVQAGPVLLREPFNPASSQPLGCLILVEPGFNSELALRQTQQLLQQLPGVDQVALVLAGQPLAPELRMPSSRLTSE